MNLVIDYINNVEIEHDLTNIVLEASKMFNVSNEHVLSLLVAYKLDPTEYYIIRDVDINIPNIFVCGEGFYNYSELLVKAYNSNKELFIEYLLNGFDDFVKFLNINERKYLEDITGKKLC